MSVERDYFLQIRGLVRWLTATVAIFLALVAGLVWYQHTSRGVKEPSFDSKIVVDPGKVQGEPSSGVGYRCRYDSPTRIATYAADSRSPLQEQQGINTPSDRHFERHHAGIPDIDPDQPEL